MASHRDRCDPDARPPSEPGTPAREVRCGCGSLLARLVDGGVELKCRRCKHTWRVPIPER